MIFFKKDKPVYHTIPDFRTLGGENKYNISPNISFEIRNAKNRRNILLSLENELPNNDFSKISSAKYQSKDILRISRRLREILELKRSTIHYELEHWIRKLEALGYIDF